MVAAVLVEAGAVGEGGRANTQDAEGKPDWEPAHGGRILAWRRQEKRPTPAGVRLFPAMK